MTEIQADTSLYTDLPRRLEAFAAALRFQSPDILQMRPRSGVNWSGANGTEDQLLGQFYDGVDFRIKPKLRELWMVEFEEGSFGHHWKSEKEARVGMPASTKVVRFVEQP